MGCEGCVTGRSPGRLPGSGLCHQVIEIPFAKIGKEGIWLRVASGDDGLLFGRFSSRHIWSICWGILDRHLGILDWHSRELG